MKSATQPAHGLKAALAEARGLLASNPRRAIEKATAILKDAPGQIAAMGILADAWRAIGDHHAMRGEKAAADAAYARHTQASTRVPNLMAPAAALG